jgi:SWI/SNF-related matrix-associated actin-dependent regulator of chromatin subfamily A-like protein 1
MLSTRGEEIWGDIVVVSYDLAQKLAAVLEAEKFKIAIVDESHFLKNASAKRTRAIVPLLQAIPRTILLTGTPALSRCRRT